MKRWWALAFSALALVAGAWAGPGVTRAAWGNEMSTTGQRLDGTWIIAVTLDSPTPSRSPDMPLTFAALNTFFPDGALIEAGGPNPTRSPVGHGQWVRVGDRQFTATFVFNTFDGQGKPTGLQRVTRSIRLSENLQEYGAVSRIEALDTKGNLKFTGAATETARRLAIGDPPPAP
jgi:hypothetical protein